jgi:hypothetical protein
MQSSSTRMLRGRFWVGTAGGAVTGILGAVTPIRPDWIEVISGWDPDQHDGSVERMIVAALLIASVTLLMMALREWRLAAEEAKANGI